MPARMHDPRGAGLNRDRSAVRVAHCVLASFPATGEVRSPAPCPVGSHAPGPASHELAGVCGSKRRVVRTWPDVFQRAGRAVSRCQGTGLAILPQPVVGGHGRCQSRPKQHLLRRSVGTAHSVRADRDQQQPQCEIPTMKHVNVTGGQTGAQAGLTAQATGPATGCQQLALTAWIVRRHRGSGGRG